MPDFIENVQMWATFSGRHFIFMLWWVWVLAVVLTTLSETFFFDFWRRRVLDTKDEGWRTVVFAALLGVLSPPSRSKVFGQAKELLAHGVSPRGVMAYLVAAQSIFIWLLLFIMELDGPQPMLGQFVAVAVVLVVLMFGLRRTPAALWEAARETAIRETDESGDVTSIAPRGPVALRFAMSLGGQIYSLWWPLLFGLAGIGFFLTLGQSDGYFSLVGTRGPLVQLGNAVVGLLVAFVTGSPLVGNALVAAGMWKAEFISYAGLSAFYLGTLVMPFALPRYYTLLGIDLAKRVLIWLVVGILAGALVATAWWWGLDWLLGAVGLRDMFESLTHSTMWPNPVPWFHHWFQSMPGMSGMSGMSGMPGM